MKKWKYVPAAIFMMAMPSVGYAADIVEPVIVDEPVSSAFDWTGLYVGISGGYVKPEFDLGFGAANASYGDGGYLIGGTVGYNVQMNSFVFGVEGDVSFADYDSTLDGANDPFGFGFATNVETDYFATIRGRLGYAFDRVLVYGTGGVAFAGLDITTPAGEINDDLTGYTVGGGIEYAFTDNITTKLEYLFSDFGDHTYALFPGNVTTDFQAHIVRVGLNYKF